MAPLGVASPKKRGKRELTVESLLDDGKDPKVGFIQIYVLDQETVSSELPPPPTLSGSQLGIGFGTKGSLRPHNNRVYDPVEGRKEPEMITRQSKKGSVKRCYIYACRDFDDKPFYYLTRVNTRVFVVDKKKIEFFPEPGVEPEEFKGTIEDFTREEEDPSCEGAYATFQEEPAVKIGIIYAQAKRPIEKPKKEEREKTEGDDVTDKPVEYEVVKEKRDVYISEGSFIADPFYYSDSGNKIIVMDKKRIRYLNPDGSEPPIDVPKKQEVKFFTSSWRL